MISPEKFAKVENVVTNMGELIMFLMTAAFESIGQTPEEMARPKTAEELLKRRAESTAEKTVDEAQLAKFKESIDDDMADRALAVVAANDVGLEPFTSKLTDEQFVQYILLMQKEDPRMGAFIGGLKAWMDEMQAKLGPPAPTSTLEQTVVDGVPLDVSEDEARVVVAETIGELADSVRKADYWFFSKTKMLEDLQASLPEAALGERCAWMEAYNPVEKPASEQIVFTQPPQVHTGGLLRTRGRVANFPAADAELTFDFGYFKDAFGWKLCDLTVARAGVAAE